MSLWMRPAALRATRPATDRPGAALVLAGGEEADQVEQAVARADEAVARALGEARGRRGTPRGRRRRARRPRPRPAPTATIASPPSARARAATSAGSGRRDVRLRRRSARRAAAAATGTRSPRARALLAASSSMVRSGRARLEMLAGGAPAAPARARSPSPSSRARRASRPAPRSASTSSPSNASMSSGGVARRAGQVGEAAHHLDQRVGVAQRRHHLLVEHGALLRRRARAGSRRRSPRRRSSSSASRSSARQSTRGSGTLMVPICGAPIARSRRRRPVSAANTVVFPAPGESGEPDLHAATPSAAAARCEARDRLRRPRSLRAGSWRAPRASGDARDLRDHLVGLVRVRLLARGPRARKRWMRSSVKPGVVRMVPSGVSSPRAEPRLLAQLARGARRPAARRDGRGRPRAAPRCSRRPRGGYWRISTTRPSSSTAATAAAPGWRIISSSTSAPFGSVTRSMPQIDDPAAIDLRVASRACLPARRVEKKRRAGVRQRAP